MNIDPPTSPLRIFIAGLGASGTSIALFAREQGYHVLGSNRRGVGTLDGVEVHALDVLDPDSVASLHAEADILIGCLSGTGVKNPDRYREIYVDGLRRIAGQLRWTGPPRVLFLSSTGVYGGQDGEWVDEKTEVNPLHPAGQVMVDAERALHAEYDNVCCLRLSGLYGPGRTRMIQQALRKGAVPKSDVWANQIHLADVGHVVVQLVQQAMLPKTLLLSDDEPALRGDIVSWMRKQLGCPEGLLEEAHSAAVSRNRGNKRVSNRLLRSMGCELTYPTFQEGYRDLITAYANRDGVRIP